MLNSESLNSVLENKTISHQSIIEIYQNAVKNPDELFLAAQSLRGRFKKKSVTFSHRQTTRQSNNPALIWGNGNWT